MEMYFIIGGFILVIITVISINNNIISRFNAAKQAWADILVQERQKEKVLPKLTSLLKEHQEFEQGLLTKVTELRSALGGMANSNEFDTDVLRDIQQKSDSLMGGIKATFEAYPELKSSELFKQVMSEISEQEENVGASICIFNSNVQAHNTGIEVFPNSLINSQMTKKDRINEFTDKDVTDLFDYKPNI